MTATHLYIVTGASRGLGQAIARQLLTAGNTVLCISRSADPALEAHAASAGADFHAWQADLTDAAPVAARLVQWLQSCDEAHHTGATLINNAALLPAVVPLRDAAAADTIAALRVGLEAPMLLTSAFLSATRTWQSPRKVLNISSGLGRRPMASQSAYCALKAGMDMFTRCAALDEALQPHGARLCSLAPGVIDTGMQQHLRGSDPKAFPDVARFAGLHASGQLASAEATARAVLQRLARPDFGDEPIADVRD
ncbi:SDR family NAD(P)-dependent oxidoreductase [Xylophilus sp. GOD-11R]|uniref:SDR family NAD(P)-dependent oxidoreductase n=1 Tax=Xylophilus sp. GOD-11R TaxID=3089814 RepID=UPI00298BECD8|nr:SDR family NAD(P)-dependent oxidoreductase [Xylophilus sp. GOD-11R]WPB59174.1 SDR family NAD(P)-dependent oxidoreductase [Xylophilus sp. GOD-11R]